MTFVVPFDGTDIAEAALARAVEFATVLDEHVVAVTVIPKNNTDYARERGWLGATEAFDLESVVATLREQVDTLAPRADFRYKVVGRYAPSGSIARRLRTVIRESDTSMVFIGTENAGRMVSSVSSVGSSVAAEEAYDVVLVRNRHPTKVDKIRQASPQRLRDSELYHPE